MTIRRISTGSFFAAIPFLIAASCVAPTDDDQLGVAPGVGSDTQASLHAAEIGMSELFARPSLVAGVDEVWLDRVEIDHLGMSHVRMDQTVDTIPVFGAKAIVHLDAAGRFRSMTDGFVRDIAVDTTPRIDDLMAVALAVESSGGWESLTDEPAVDLQILRRPDADHLTYRVALTRLGASPSMPVIFIDAHTGEEVWRYENLKAAALTHADVRTFDMHGSTSTKDATQAYDTDPVAALAHDSVIAVTDYFRSRHGRDGYDDAGTPVLDYVHYGEDHVNAYWTGKALMFGDGDGNYSGPLGVPDIVAHEFTHGVIDTTAALIYQGESGALSEATGDVMAAVSNKWNDKTLDLDRVFDIGEDCWTPVVDGDALRYMDDPTQDGVSRDHFSERYTGSQDNGGVHWNAGIANLAFFLMAQGGDHPDIKHRVNTVTGLGITKAGDVWYRALSVYMTPTTDLRGARDATEQACQDLGFGGCGASVSAAWNEVGVP